MTGVPDQADLDSRVFFDTNILLYMFDRSSNEKRNTATELAGKPRITRKCEFLRWMAPRPVRLPLGIEPGFGDKKKVRALVLGREPPPGSSVHLLLILFNPCFHYVFQQRRRQRFIASKPNRAF